MMTIYLSNEVNFQSFKFLMCLSDLLPFCLLSLAVLHFEVSFCTCFAEISSYCEMMGVLFKYPRHYYDYIFKMGEQSTHPIVVVSIANIVFSWGVHCNCKENENNLVSILIMCMWKQNILGLNVVRWVPLKPDFLGACKSVWLISNLAYQS